MFWASNNNGQAFEHCPIDPQLLIPGPQGIVSTPAQAIIDQFDEALSQVIQPGGQGWGALLQQYGPALIVTCRNLIAMSANLVSDWMEKWMFAGDPDAKNKAKTVATYLSNHKQFKSHGRHISRDKARSHGLVVDNLEDDAVFQDNILSVFHATTHTFGATPAVKIIENHKGKAFIKIHR